MNEQTFLMARQEQHAQALMAEARRERASKIGQAQRGLRCRLCLRLAQALMGLGTRLERSALGGLAQAGTPAARLG